MTSRSLDAQNSWSSDFQLCCFVVLSLYSCVVVLFWCFVIVLLCCFISGHASLICCVVLLFCCFVDVGMDGPMEIPMTGGRSEVLRDPASQDERKSEEHTLPRSVELVG